MSAKLKVIVASLCLAASAGVVAVVLVRSDLTGQSRQPTPPRQTASEAHGTAVVVATALIARGQRLSRNKLTLKRIEGAVVGQPFTALEPLANAVALDTIQPGQIIMAGEVARGSDVRPGLSVLVPDGMRAVALRVDDEIAVGNFVSPGDRVDIQVVFSAKQAAGLHDDVSAVPSAEARVLLQDIEVLSAGDTLTTTNDGRAIRMHTITVAVKPHDAQLLAVAKETGSFYLALRNPVDRSVTMLPAVSVGDLRGDGSARHVSARQSSKSSSARRVQVIEGQASSMRTVQEE